MPKYPADPHLFAYKVDGETQKIVRAASIAEAREYMAARQRIDFIKLSPAAAFAAAHEGIELLDAKPEYAAIDDRVQEELFSEPFADANGDQDALSHDDEVQHV